MKQASIAAIGISLLLIIFTSAPYTKPNDAHTHIAGSVYWMNPDGTKGHSATMAASDRSLAWTNPDGTHGLVDRLSERSREIEYAWANPDGFKSRSVNALEGESNHDLVRLSMSR